MPLDLNMLQPAIARLLDTLDRIADASERSATVLEQLTSARPTADAASSEGGNTVRDASKGDGNSDEIDVDRLDGL